MSISTSTTNMARSRRDTTRQREASTLSAVLSPERWRTRGDAGRFIPLYLPNSRKCSDCGINKTKQWRRDVDGKSTLCNACGIRVRRNRKTNISTSTRNTTTTRNTSSRKHTLAYVLNPSSDDNNSNSHFG